MSLPQMGWYQCLVTVVSLLPSYPDIRNFKVPSEIFILVTHTGCSWENANLQLSTYQFLWSYW